MSRTASQGSSRYKLHHPHPQHVSRSQEAAADSTSRSLSPFSHFPLNPSPQLSTQLEVHSKHWDVLPLLQKSTLGKNKIPPPPTSHFILPSAIPFHLYLLLKAKIKPLGYLGPAGLVWGHRRGQQRDGTGPSGAGAGDPAVTWEPRAGRQVSLAARVPTLLTAAPQGEVADLTAAFYAKTCPRV